MEKRFVCFLSGKQKDLMTKELIIRHVGYLKTLKQDGKLPFCGPCADGTAVMILAADTLEEARELVAADPFSKANYYRDRRIVELQEATIENNFHLDEVLARF